MSQKFDLPGMWEDLVAEQENKLYRTALAILGRPQQAEQVVQDVFEEYLKRAPRNLDDSGVWLLKRLVIRCKEWGAAAPAPGCILQELPPAEKEEAQGLETFFSLRWDERVILHLFYCEGCSSEEIAGIMGQRPGAVRLRLMEARAKLRSLDKNKEAKNGERLHFVYEKTGDFPGNP